MVYPCLHLVFLGMDILYAALGIIDANGITAHLSYRHTHVRILVFLHIPVRNSEAGAGKGQTTAIDKLILGDMSFSDDRWSPAH